MTDKFTIKVPGDGFGDFEDCQYHAGKKGSYDPFIDLDSRTCLTKLSCFAILRKLAELSEESIPNHYKIDHGIVSLKGNYDEGALERVLWNFLKAKYRKKSMTPEKKIDKASKELSEIYNAGIPYNLHEAWKKIGNVLDILNQL